MAYTSPTTRATDYVYTAATFQSDITDNIKWLAEDKADEDRDRQRDEA